MLLSAISIIGFLFQNCQEVSGDNFSKNSVGNNSSSSELASNNNSNAQAQVSSSSFPSAPVTNSDANALKVSYLANGSTSSDCSKSDSILSLEVTNAGSDILVCPEFNLDMPAGHPRKGESYACTNSNSFVVPPSSWKYDSGARKWTATEVVSNSAYLVPGSFYVVVKDNQGKIYKSAAAVIKRVGYANCQTSSAPYKKCNWSGGIVIGPTPNYAITTNQSCQYGTERYRHVDEYGNVYNFQCICQ